MAQPNVRATQLADQIRDYLAQWIARDNPGSFVVVTDVTLSEDMQRATVWISSPSNEVTVFTHVLNSSKRYQHLLTQNLKRFRVPRLVFALDTAGDVSPT